MNHWQVRLTGEQKDLSDLSKFIVNEPVKVKLLDSFYFLFSENFKSEDPNIIYKEAEKVIDQINGAASLFFGHNNFSSVGFNNITLVQKDGSKQSFIYLSASIKVRSRLTAEVTVIDSQGNEINVDNCKNDLSLWLSKAAIDKDISDILRFFRDPDWFKLYKIYEIIRDDFNGEVALLRENYVLRRDIKRFTQAAQSRELLGDEARHASHKYKPPQIPMTIDEAILLIKLLFTTWVNSK